MTKTKQDNSARPVAVELPEAALDAAVGGAVHDAQLILVGIEGESKVVAKPGTGFLRSTDSG